MAMDKVVKNRRRKFWIQLAFWLFVYAYQLDYYATIEWFNHALVFAALQVLIIAFIGYFNLLVLIPHVLKKQGGWAYVLSLLVCLFGSMVLYNLAGFEALLMGDESWWSKASFALGFTLYALISYLYWYFEDHQREKQRLLQLENEKLNVELGLLKAQVTPHFLFNSLNNIYTLSLQKSDDAPLMVEKLSSILRYLLYQSKNKLVPLKDEVKIIQDYLDMHLMRKIPAAANISFEVAGVDEKHEIAPLMLINVVENAFKHSDVNQSKDGYLRISLEVSEANRIYFKVENSRVATTSEDGIGWTNLKQQLEHIYFDAFDLQVRDKDNSYAVTLSLNV